ncbi:MAG: ATP-binding protein, partial [Proteobacteria bacterium]|nr:ATP-binding protein [Pseudomonadota bacterium]
PDGICGSGVIRLLAEMFLAGLVDSSGVLVAKKDPLRMIDTRHGKGYIIVPGEQAAHGKDILITEADIKNLMRSKGAMFTILRIVTQSVGITFKEVEHFFVAGTFGSYIEPEKAITIGMLPDIPTDKYKRLGNASGKGAVEVLLSNRARRELSRIRDKITYLEMNVNADFMSQFTSSLFLPHTDLSLFPSVAKKRE